VREFLGSRNFAVEFPADDAPALDARINAVYLPHMVLGYLAYGREIVLKAAPERTDYWLQFTARGRFDVAVAHESIRCDARTAAVLSPGGENVIRPAAGNGRLALSISRDAVVRALAALLGRPVTGPISFAPRLGLDQGYARGIARHVRAAVEDLEEDEPLLRGAVSQTAFEQFVITALLVSHPHGYSAELRRPAKRPAPQTVRRAVDYIEANLTAPVTLEDVVRAAGVAGRVLFRHFRQATGESPMAYLRNARFQRVRDALRRARADDRIVDIAALWGFDHIGRFSVEYRRRFGEKPSETKAAARRR